MRITLTEHVAILGALIAEDDDRAEELMAAHIISSRDAVLVLTAFEKQKGRILKETPDFYRKFCFRSSPASAPLF
jgi:hypothetical protein